MFNVLSVDALGLRYNRHGDAFFSLWNDSVLYKCSLRPSIDDSVNNVLLQTNLDFFTSHFLNSSQFFNVIW